jgi:hypothetical protein
VATTVTVLARQSRQGAHTSSAAQIPAGTVQIKGDLDMSAANRQNTARLVRWRIESCPDNLWQPGTYAADHYDEWVGGTHVDKFSGQTVANQSAVTIPVSPEDAAAGYWYRLVLDVPTAFAVGATVTLLTAADVPT